MTENKIAILMILLILTMTVTTLTIPIVNAHEPPWDVPTYAYVTVAPNPVGVGQEITIAWWLDKMPPGGAGYAGERYIGQTLEVTKPNGVKETMALGKSDPVGAGYTKYTPDQAGEYTFKFIYPGQVITGSSGSGIYNYNIAINDTYLPSNATTSVTVQEEPISSPPSYPLPEEYWVRPIEGQNNEWYQVASNWLSGASIFQKVQMDGIAPNTSHIMWTMPIRDGGVVGGSRTGIDGMTYYDGTHYETMFKDPLIMYGRLYFTLPQGGSSGNGGYICVDLRTGQEIWYNSAIGVSGSAAPSFGQLYNYESMNQHGVIPNGYLWTSNFASAYDPLTGQLLFNLTSVPSGTEVYTDKGEIVRYVLNSQGKWLALWNNTAAHALTNSGNPDDLTSTNFNQWRPIGKSVNASDAYSWNITLSWLPEGSSIQAVLHDDILLGRTGALPSSSSSLPYTMWLMSLNPNSRGTLLWTKTYNAPPGNISRSFRFIDDVNRVFIFWDKETIQYSGYSLDDGTLLWTTPTEASFNMYAGGGGSVWTQTTAYGKLYSCGYSGNVYCYDTKTGSQLWNYSTGAKAGLAAPYGGYPLGIVAVADGKIYFHVNEHSSGAPYWKGAELYCLNAETGNEMWTIAFHGSSGYPPWGYAVADGYLVGLNLYDAQVYCFGRGPSAMTVEAPMSAVTLGSSLVIRGTITDIAAGVNQNEQAARFPNGIPVVSDDSMSAWMEYIYMQKPRPENTTGVPISLSVLDSNNNYRPIGSTVSNDDGFFTYNWTPDISGQYTVYASFAGSESYWPSHAITSFAVDTSTATPSPYAETIQQPTEMYILGTGIAIIIAVAVVGALMLIAIRKRP